MFDVLFIHKAFTRHMLYRIFSIDFFGKKITLNYYHIILCIFVHFLFPSEGDLPSRKPPKYHKKVNIHTILLFNMYATLHLYDRPSHKVLEYLEFSSKWLEISLLHQNRYIQVFFISLFYII